MELRGGLPAGWTISSAGRGSAWVIHMPGCAGRGHLITAPLPANRGPSRGLPWAPMRYSGHGETPVDSDFGGRILLGGMWQLDCLKHSNPDRRPINDVRFVGRCDDGSTSWIG
jgi:hypothetical protein